MSTDDPADDEAATVRLRHEGRATVWGGPADLGATGPGDEVIVPEDDAAHYVQHHGFVPVAADEEVEESSPEESLDDLSHTALRSLAAGTDGINGNQSADALREQLAEHYSQDEE